MGHVRSRVEHGREHHRVLTDQERSSPTVWRSYDAQLAPALGHAETPLLVAGLEILLRGAQPDLEDVRRVDPRRVGLAVANAASRRHAPELARLDKSRAASRIFPSERSLANEGHDLGIVRCVAQNVASRRKMAFVENLEFTEAVIEVTRARLFF